MKFNVVEFRSKITLSKNFRSEGSSKYTIILAKKIIKIHRI